MGPSFKAFLQELSSLGAEPEALPADSAMPSPPHCVPVRTEGFHGPMKLRPWGARVA